MRLGRVVVKGVPSAHVGRKESGREGGENGGWQMMDVSGKPAAGRRFLAGCLVLLIR